MQLFRNHTLRPALHLHLTFFATCLCFSIFIINYDCLTVQITERAEPQHILYVYKRFMCSQWTQARHTKDNNRRVLIYILRSQRHPCSEQYRRAGRTYTRAISRRCSDIVSTERLQSSCPGAWCARRRRNSKIR